MTHAPLRAEIAAVEAGPEPRTTIIRAETIGDNGREAISLLLSPGDSLTLEGALGLIRERRTRRVVLRDGGGEG